MPGQLGNSGGGRKSAYQERADAEALVKAYFEDNDQEHLESKIRSGKFSIWDRVVLTAMEGDTRILQTLTNRIFPEKTVLPDGDAITAVIIKRGAVEGG